MSPNFYFNQTIFFLDVGQGDATFIQNTNNKGNILIDANQGTLSFLKTLGNIKIDYFFITHGDSDHAIEAKDIIKEFQVNNIIVSLHDNSPLVKDLDNYNIKRVNSGVNYYINGISIEILGPLKKYNNLNNNSLVLHLKTDNKTILFTGDVEKEAIADLCQIYEHRLKSDILHVAHHGAKEGTSIEFLKYVNPKEAIISVGLNNLYNHPNSQTISNLETYNVKIFLTSKQQTIIKRKYRFSFLN